MSVKLSVIVPVYNVEKYLRECLDSLVNQTFKDMEIICVNDGSLDSSLNILQEYENKYSNIKVLSQENSGQSVARNVGLKIAQGEYITFVDSDDYIELDTYEVACSKMEQEQVDLVVFGIDVFGLSNFHVRKQDDEYYRIKYRGKIELNKDSLFNIDVSPCNKIFRSIIIKSNDISYAVGLTHEDAEFYWEYLSCTNQQVFLIDKKFYHYRRIVNSTMSRVFSGNSDKSIDHLRIVKNIYEFFVKHNKQKYISKFLPKIFTQYTQFPLRYCVKKEDKLKALNLAREYANEMFANKNPNNFIKYIKSGEFDYIHKPNLKIGNKIYSKKRFYKPISDVDEKIKTIFGFKFIKTYGNPQFNFKRTEYLDELSSKNIKQPFNVEQILSSIKSAPEYLLPDSGHNYFNCLINQNKFTHKSGKFSNDKTIICWADVNIGFNQDNLKYAIENNKNVVYVDDGFLRSICGMNFTQVDESYKKSLSFVVDDLNTINDATKTNRLEQMLNDENLILSNNQLERANNVISSIIKNRLSKYNNFPINVIKLPDNNKKKILLMFSYCNEKLNVNESIYSQMVSVAIENNPNAQIIIAFSDDVYFDWVEYIPKEFPDVLIVKDAVNPIDLISQVDEVYVGHSLAGMESLMLGKKVHTFGCPFYAGWGLTIDHTQIERRNRTRTLQELFYIAYIMYSLYVNPKTSKRCEIEEAIDYLIDLREEYFEKIVVRD